MQPAPNTSGIALVSIAIVLFAIGGGYYWFDGTPVPAAPTGALEVVATTTDVTTSGMSWTFTDAGTDSYGMPHTLVTLNRDDKKYSIGKYDGNCKSVLRGVAGIGGEQADANELSPRVQCYFAGGGNEIGVFTLATSTVVEVGALDEGDAETPAFRGNFKALFSL